MPRFLARQPDGNFSLFCTNVDSFIAGDLTEERILADSAKIWKGGDEDFAVAQLNEAKADGPPWNNGQVSEDGLSRFRKGLRVMAQMHGLDEVVEYAESLENYEPGVAAEVTAMKEMAASALRR